MYQIILLLMPFFLFANFDSRPRTLFQMHEGYAEEAIEGYLGREEPELLREMALMLFQYGIRPDNENEVRLLTLLGAGISMDERALPILEQGLNSKLPLLQLVALHQMVRFNCDRTDAIIERRIGKCHPLVRLEGALILSQNRSPLALPMVEALHHQLPKKLCVVLPQMYAAIGDHKSKALLRKLLQHSEESVRAETIIQTTKYGHDDLLPDLRKLASNHGAMQQEALAYAFGTLKDEEAIPSLCQLTYSPIKEVKLAAYLALYKLGKEEVKDQLFQMAKTGFPFAIYSLGDIPGSEALLLSLTKSCDRDVRLVSTLALLKRKDEQVIECVDEFLLLDSTRLCFKPQKSGGSSLTAWKIAVPKNDEDEKLQELSLRLKEEMLRSLSLMNEKLFLSVAARALQSNEADIIPEVTKLLASMQTEGSTCLLNKYRQKVGDPLTRNWCNLALYLQGERGPYAELLRDFVIEERNVPLASIRAFIPKHEQSEIDRQEEIPLKDASLLYIAILEAFLRKQEESALNTIITVMQKGHPLNRFALAGLLLRATE